MKNISRENILFMHRLLLPTLIFGFCLFYFWEVNQLPNQQDRLLITPVFWLMVPLFLLVLLHEWKEKKKGADQKEEEPLLDYQKVEQSLKGEQKETDVVLTRAVFQYMVSIGVYLILIPLIGFIIATLLFLPVTMRMLGATSWKLIGITSVLLVLFIHVLFSIWLNIPIPTLL